MRRPSLNLPLTLVLLLGPALSRAEEFCVDNSTDLQQALATAASNSQDDTIQIVAGIYTLSPVAFPASEPFALDLSGGWTPGCLASIRDPEVTLLLSAVADAVLLDFQSGTVNSSISNLTLINGLLRFRRTASVTLEGVNIEAGDRDGDGVNDLDDAFPDDPDEQSDTDGDGIGNNEDPDDDNDRMPDLYEEGIAGLNPLVDDADGDLDEDGFSNFDEFEQGTAPDDAGDFPQSVPVWLKLVPEILRQ